MEETIYIGSGKEKRFDGGGAVLNMSISLSKIMPGVKAENIAPELKDFVYTTDDGRVFIRIKAVEKKQVDQYGKSHFVAIDTWKPESSGNVANSEKVFGGSAEPADSFGDAVPF